jgi:hypothetical protein
MGNNKKIKKRKPCPKGPGHNRPMIRYTPVRLSVKLPLLVVLSNRQFSNPTSSPISFFEGGFTGASVAQHRFA